MNNQDSFIKNPFGELVSQTGLGLLAHRVYPVARPSAQLLIIHGMAEHQIRYREFANYLQAKQIRVYTLDLPGHGLDCPRDHLGFFGDKRGSESVLDDLRAYLTEIRTYDSQTPLFLLGHSMGSMLARLLAAEPEWEFQGVIFSGTMGKNAGLLPGKILVALSRMLHGRRKINKRLARMSQIGYFKKIAQPRTAVDWLSRDEQAVTDYINDPFCGFTFRNGGFEAMFDWLGTISGISWARRVPLALPILLFAGDHDPVGAYGAGVKQVADWLSESGHRGLELKLYPGGRHEMLNETNRSDVMRDTADWILAQLEPSVPIEEESGKRL